jgi:hypothetical protein
VREDVARQELELLGRHVRDDGRHDVDAPAQRGRQRLVEIAGERPDAVPAGTRDGDGIDVGGDHGRPRACPAQHDGDRPAAGAQVDRDPVRRQQRHRAVDKRLGLRAGHEHAGVHTNTGPAEAHPTGDPRERLSGEPASEEFLERSAPRLRGIEQHVGLRGGLDGTTLGEREEDARPLPAQRADHGGVRVVC